jgi:hypothetical protein
VDADPSMRMSFTRASGYVHGDAAERLPSSRISYAGVDRWRG